jgi:hypothetical protein
VAIPRIAVLIGGLLLVAMLAMLGLQYREIESQRDIAAAQAERSKRVAEKTLPAIDLARPLLRDLDGEQVTETLRLVATGARTLRDAGLVSEAALVLEQVLGLDLLPRAAGTLRRVEEALRETERLALLPRAARSFDRLAEVLAIQRVSLGVLRESRDIQRETLAIQRQALERIESLDRKTGGELADPAPPP